MSEKKKYENKNSKHFSRDLNPSKEIQTFINPETLIFNNVISVVRIFTRRGSVKNMMQTYKAMERATKCYKCRTTEENLREKSLIANVTSENRSELVTH